MHHPFKIEIKPTTGIGLVMIITAGRKKHRFYPFATFEKCMKIANMWIRLNQDIIYRRRDGSFPDMKNTDKNTAHYFSPERR